MDLSVTEPETRIDRLMEQVVCLSARDFFFGYLLSGLLLSLGWNLHRLFVLHNKLAPEPEPEPCCVRSDMPEDIRICQ